MTSLIFISSFLSGYSSKLTTFLKAILAFWDFHFLWLLFFLMNSWFAVATTTLGKHWVFLGALISSFNLVVLFLEELILLPTIWKFSIIIPLDFMNVFYFVGNIYEQILCSFVTTVCFFVLAITTTFAGVAIVLGLKRRAIPITESEGSHKSWAEKKILFVIAVVWFCFALKLISELANAVFLQSTYGFKVKSENFGTIALLMICASFLL